MDPGLLNGDHRGLDYGEGLSPPRRVRLWGGAFTPQRVRLWGGAFTPTEGCGPNFLKMFYTGNGILWYIFVAFT